MDHMPHPITECIIDDIKMEYHACADASTHTEQEAKQYHSKMEYMGKGTGLVINGRHQFKDEEYYFFKRK